MAEPPAVQHGGDADAGAQMLWIGGDRGQRFGRGLEQQVVDDGLVLVGDVGDARRQREHDMEVQHGQQIGLALGEPLLRRGALALRAMPIATSVVGDLGVDTILVSLDMSPERCPAAALDG
ncbi:hypothetical protein ACVWW3_004862 [Bradyrhizobium sp. LM2.9]